MTVKLPKERNVQAFPANTAFVRRGMGDNGGEMEGLLGSQLLRLPVRTNGILLGRPVDLIVDTEGLRALGFDVLCGDDVHRFLPLAAAEPREEEIHVESALVLLDEAELRFYRARGRALRELRGSAVERHEANGTLADVVVDASGALHEVVLAGERSERVPADADVAIAGAPRPAPAA